MIDGTSHAAEIASRADGVPDATRLCSVAIRAVSRTWAVGLLACVARVRRLMERSIVTACERCMLMRAMDGEGRNLRRLVMVGRSRDSTVRATAAVGAVVPRRWATQPR